jgi:hypothetical protein
MKHKLHGCMISFFAIFCIGTTEALTTVKCKPILINAKLIEGGLINTSNQPKEKAFSVEIWWSYDEEAADRDKLRDSVKTIFGAPDIYTMQLTEIATTAEDLVHLAPVYMNSTSKEWSIDAKAKKSSDPYDGSWEIKWNWISPDMLYSKYLNNILVTDCTRTVTN